MWESTLKVEKTPNFNVVISSCGAGFQPALNRQVGKLPHKNLSLIRFLKGE
jgi:hypothetical protein